MRTALVLALAAALAGCSLITLDLTPRLQPLEEEVVEGSGAAKVLLLDVSGFLADEAFEVVRLIGEACDGGGILRLLEGGAQGIGGKRLVIDLYHLIQAQPREADIAQGRFK